MKSKEKKIKPTTKGLIFDPDLEERKKDGYYFQDAYCENCNRPSGYSDNIDVMIPEGVEIPTVKYRCPNCKCLTLKIL